MTNPYESPAVMEHPVGGNDVSRLMANPVFQGILLTQFLGAFNDNYFKQMVLLKCTELAKAGSSDMQPWATAAFALPFVLLSGLGGYLSDRYSRRTVIVLCKVAEIVIVGLALLVLLILPATNGLQLTMLIFVLALLGAQSAIFGPSKYGILPELFSHRQLLPVNGSIQMTTFLAIIFGTAAAGIALDELEDSLWMCSVIALAIALTGTLTSLLIHRTPASHPNLPLRPENAFLPRETIALLKRSPKLFQSLLVATVFWFIGGAAQPAVNNLGEHVFGMNKTRTSLMTASIGVGIAAGCAIAGFFSTGKSEGGKWVQRGGWMTVCSLLLIAFLSSPVAARPDVLPGESGIWNSIIHAGTFEWTVRGSMLLLGLSAGVFVVPIQTYIQEAPPADQKGRVIGAQNFLNWVGILLSAAFLVVMGVVTNLVAGDGSAQAHSYAVFVVLAAVMLPIAIWYRLQPAHSDDASSTKI
ncbi:MAG: MFS transporter [Planctomycetaceae bacterium]